MNLKQIFETEFSDLTLKQKIIGIIFLPMIYVYMINDMINTQRRRKK